MLLRFFAVLLCGAMILGPLLYFTLHKVFPLPFHRAMDRGLLLSALLALGSVRRRIRLHAWWRLDAGAWKQALLGLAIALVSIQFIVGLEMAVVGLGWASLTSREMGRLLVTALAAALLVPLAEETIFRGFLQSELVGGLGMRLGCLLGALIFMLAHFVKIPVEVDRAPVHVWSGATSLALAFVPVLHGEFLGGRGVNLLLIGLLLGGAFLRLGTLWLNYGLHGGWILGLILLSGLTHPTRTVSFWGGDLLSSPLTTAVLILLGFWLWLFYRRPSPESGRVANAP